MTMTGTRCGLSKRFLVLLLSLFLPMACAGTNWAAAPEIRAVWADLQFNADPEKGANEVREFVKSVADANFNAIFPWVSSEYFAALTDEKYQKIVPVAKWDALGQLLKVSQEKGLQVHLWYSFTGNKSSRSPEFDPVHGGNPNWAAIRTDELYADDTGRIFPKRMTTLCPLRREGREWELRLLESLLEKYPSISGIHIEEPGYEGGGNCVCDLCRGVFQQIYGLSDRLNADGPQAADLKCLGTTEFMRELRKRTRAKNRFLVLSANGAFSWDSDRGSGRDWKRWAELKWLDFYVPQIYSGDLNLFRNRVQRTISDLGGACPVIVGIAVKSGPGPEGKYGNSVETILREIDIARQSGAKGIVIFRDKFLKDEHLIALKAGPFREPATFPKFGE